MNNYSNAAVQAFIAPEKHQRTLMVITRLMAGETAYAIGKDLGLSSQAVTLIKNKYL